MSLFKPETQPHSPATGYPGGRPLLSVQDLHFAYDETPVLTGVHLDLLSGETVGIIGPNGSGKSTLLKLLGGILPSPPGSVTLQDRDLPRYSRKQLAQIIAWIPQDFHLAFSFSVSDVVMMGRHPYLSAFRFESREDVEIVQRAMEITDTLKFSGRRFNELSGGEKQRVLIASAIAQSPQLMLLDEPTASLDLKYQLQVIQILQRLNLQRGITLVLAMHDLHLASRFCSRLILLKNGRIVRDGPAEWVLQKEILEEVYGVSLRIVTDPEDGSIHITPEGL